VQHAHRLTGAMIDGHRGREMVDTHCDELDAQMLGQAAP
jgi:hypothetical protein